MARRQRRSFGCVAGTTVESTVAQTFTITAAPAGGVTTPWFPTGGADFLRCELWGGGADTLDQFAILYSPNAVDQTPVQPAATAITSQPAGTSITTGAVAANPAIFHIYSPLAGIRNVAWCDYIAFQLSATGGDQALCAMAVSMCYFADYYA